MSGQPIEPAPVVDLVDDLGGAAGSLEVELATSLLYPQCHYSWRQLQRTVAALPAPRIAELIALGAKHRGRHDELPRTFSAGQGLKFDILMDIGGFRDMHRHRRCVQLLQPFTSLHGYEEPVCPGQPTLAEAGLADTYTTAMDAAHAAYRTLRDANSNGNTTYCHPERARSPATKEGVILSEARSAESKDLRLPRRRLPPPPRHPRPRHVQDGLRRSPLHRRTPLRRRRPLQLPPRRLGDVPRRRQTPPRARPLLPHRRRQQPVDPSICR
jgi:hypothetical protein